MQICVSIVITRPRRSRALKLHLFIQMFIRRRQSVLEVFIADLVLSDLVLEVNNVLRMVPNPECDLPAEPLQATSNQATKLSAIADEPLLTSQ